MSGGEKKILKNVNNSSKEFEGLFISSLSWCRGGNYHEAKEDNTGSLQLLGRIIGLELFSDLGVLGRDTDTTMLPFPSNRPSLSGITLQGFVGHELRGLVAWG